jgi:ADP-ribose pyrophosphatase YjhB (NUDIX family)
MEPGESVAEGCEREVFEETGLSVRVIRFVDVYSHPDQLTVYSKIDKFQIVAYISKQRSSEANWLPAMKHPITDISQWRKSKSWKCLAGIRTELWIHLPIKKKHL